MKTRLVEKIILGFAFALLCATAWALPTSADIEAATRQGNYAQAETMMQEVVTARPNSAKAHYVYAEILAHNRNFSKAADETRLARQLDPKITFTTPDRFAAFEQLLTREQERATASARAATQGSNSAAPAAARREVETSTRVPTRDAAGSGMPGWVWPVGLAVIGFFLWRAFSRSRARGAAAAGPLAAGSMNNGYANQGVNPAQAPYGGAPGYGPGVPMGRPGSGMLGTGLAVAGGVAGGMLLDRMLHHGGDGAAGQNPGNVGAGGLEPGMFDDANNPAAQELVDRPMDFGSGGDWDSGGDIGGNVADAGGGGDWE